MTTILGIDGGNHRVKVWGPHGVIDFSSALGAWRERNLKQKFGYDDMEWTYNGRRGFGGTLASLESEWAATRKGESKAHEDALIRILLAIHRYRSPDESYKIVVGQPIKGHTQSEKDKIKNMVLGHHEIAVNGSARRFKIERVEVGAEGVVAALASPGEGKRRIVEIGSGTVNFATVIGVLENGVIKTMPVDKESWSVPIGTENFNGSDPDMARGIANEALQRWKASDHIEIAGCTAEIMQPHLAKHFRHTGIINPAVKFKNPHEPHLPACAYANAFGLYEIARKLYG